VIESITREGGHTSERGHIKDNAAAVILPHYLRSPCSYSYDAEEVRLELIVHLLFRCRFRIACKLVPGIVDQDVDMELVLEVVCRCLESLFDGRR